MNNLQELKVETGIPIPGWSGGFTKQARMIIGVLRNAGESIEVDIEKEEMSKLRVILRRESRKAGKYFQTRISGEDKMRIWLVRKL